MQRIKSTLFLDFDNIFGGLFELDRETAYALANEPIKWLEALATQPRPDGFQRDFLIRRAYFNPVGRVRDEKKGNESGWFWLSKFRPNLIQAGFEVVDCPPLTVGQKNAADIRIVIDVLEFLGSNIRYDEFIIASSDSDFAPLCQHLRARDRQAVIISAGPTSVAYRNIANSYLDAAEMIDLFKGGEQMEEIAPPVKELDAQWKDEGEKLWCVAKNLIDNSDEPILLSYLGSKLRLKFGEVIDESNWFGSGGLSDFMRSMSAEKSGIRIEGNHAWNASKHPDPMQYGHLPELIAQFCRVTDFPRISSKDCDAVIKKIADYATKHEFNFTECSMWTRDHLVEDGFQVGRKAINYLIRGTLLGGKSLDSQPPPSVDDIRNALVKNLVDRANALSLELPDNAEAKLNNWLCGEEMA